MPPPGNYCTRNSKKSQQEEAAVNIVTVSCDSGGKRDYARYVDIVAVSCDSSEPEEELPAGSITVTQTGATEVHPKMLKDAGMEKVNLSAQKTQHSTQRCWRKQGWKRLTTPAPIAGKEKEEQDKTSTSNEEASQENFDWRLCGTVVFLYGRGGLTTLTGDKVAAIGAGLWRPLENEPGRPRGQQNFDWRLCGTNRVRCHPRRPADFITTGNPLNDTVTTEVVPESNEAKTNSYCEHTRISWQPIRVG